jgi:hypothetical protein
MHPSTVGVGWMLAIAGCGWIGRGAEPLGEEEEPRPLAPVAEIDTWLDAFHVEKDDPTHVAEVHHFCHERDADLIQCVLYDSDRPDARLVGVEYIVPEATFEGLPDREQAYWHPHNYEILSGTLVAAGMPAAQEDALMRALLNSYGKVWHTWEMGAPGRPGAPLPTGEARLGWSFNAAGELPERLVNARDARLGVDSATLRERRRPLIRDAHPQEGVDALRDAFPGRKPFPGVRERSGRGGETR